MRDKLSNYHRWLAVVATYLGQLIARLRLQQRRIWQNPNLDRAGIDVIRHRVRTWSSRRRQQELLVVLIALVTVGLGTVTVGAVTAEEPPPSASADLTGTDRDSAADRGDRSGREDTDGRAQAPGDRDSRAEAQQSKARWVSPMPDANTTSCFGTRGGVPHQGVDLAAPPGTPIQAVGAGTVSEAGWAFPGYGISVVIDHGDGYYTHYAHASEAKVSVGDKVEPGDVIALEGSTGDSSGPHLHFEVHKGMWNQVEPTQWLSNRDVGVGGC